MRAGVVRTDLKNRHMTPALFVLSLVNPLDWTWIKFEWTRSYAYRWPNNVDELIADAYISLDM